MLSRTLYRMVPSVGSLAPRAAERTPGPEAPPTRGPNPAVSLRGSCSPSARLRQKGRRRFVDRARRCADPIDRRPRYDGHDDLAHGHASFAAHLSKSAVERDVARAGFHAAREAFFDGAGHGMPPTMGFDRRYLGDAEVGAMTLASGAEYRALGRDATADRPEWRTSAGGAA